MLSWNNVIHFSNVLAQVNAFSNPQTLLGNLTSIYYIVVYTYTLKVTEYVFIIQELYNSYTY